MKAPFTRAQLNIIEDDLWEYIKDCDCRTTYDKNDEAVLGDPDPNCEECCGAQERLAVMKYLRSLTPSAVADSVVRTTDERLRDLCEARGFHGLVIGPSSAAAFRMLLVSVLQDIEGALAHG